MLLLTLDQPEVRKRYTAASLDANLAKREAICRALAEGHGLLRIARAFGVSHHLVSTLRDTRPELVAIEKQQLSKQLSRILKMTADRYEEALEKGMIPARDLPIPFGIFADKKAALDGDASMIVEHRHRVEVGAAGYLERLKAAAAVDVESTATIEITGVSATNSDLAHATPHSGTVATTAPTAAGAGVGGGLGGGRGRRDGDPSGQTGGQDKGT